MALEADCVFSTVLEARCVPSTPGFPKPEKRGATCYMDLDLATALEA